MARPATGVHGYRTTATAVICADMMQHAELADASSRHPPLGLSRGSAAPAGRCQALHGAAVNGVSGGKQRRND